jgi:hypothetical protein
MQVKMKHFFISVKMYCCFIIYKNSLIWRYDINPTKITTIPINVLKLKSSLKINIPTIILVMGSNITKTYIITDKAI